MLRRLVMISLLLSASAAPAHTLFLKPPARHLDAGPVTLDLVNGTFWESENLVDEQRVTEVLVTGADGQPEPAESSWQRQGTVNRLTVGVASPGTHVVALGTRPRKVRLDAADFDFYLRYEGLTDDLGARRARGEAEVAAAEHYAKFAKAIVQVGQRRTSGYAAVAGHPVEIVPLVNPADLQPGDRFRARILHHGEPLAGEWVFASSAAFREQTAEGIPLERARVRSSAEGVVEFPVTEAGLWYVRFIELRRVSDAEHWYSNLLVWLGAEQPRIVYESLWATLTFEVR